MLLQLVLAVEEETPEANDVVAGWTGLFIILGLIAAVAVLGWSLTKQLKKVDRAEQEGVYGESDKPSADDPAAGDDSR